MNEVVCKYCRGLGHCPDCQGTARTSLSGVVRDFCNACLGLGKCPKCDGLKTIAKLTTIGAWRQAVVQDGLLI